jgi:hypothetical protein
MISKTISNTNEKITVCEKKGLEEKRVTWNRH